MRARTLIPLAGAAAVLVGPHGAADRPAPIVATARSTSGKPALAERALGAFAHRITYFL